MVVYYSTAGASAAIAWANELIQRILYSLPAEEPIRVGFVSNVLDPCQPRPARGPFRPVVSLSPVDVEFRANISARISELLQSPGVTNTAFEDIVGSLEDINRVLQASVPGAPGDAVSIVEVPNCTLVDGRDVNLNCGVVGVANICYQPAVQRDCPLLCGRCDTAAVNLTLDGGLNGSALGECWCGVCAENGCAGSKCCAVGQVFPRVLKEARLAPYQIQAVPVHALSTAVNAILIQSATRPGALR